MILPDREHMQRMGWTHQVEYRAGNFPCFQRFKTAAAADHLADILKRDKNVSDVVVIDLVEAMRVN